MAGGSAFLALAGPVGWTIGGAALLGSGIYCYSQNRRLAEEAAEKRMEVERHIRSLEAANRKIAKIQRNTAKVVEGCEGDLRWLKTAPNDYRRFSKEQKQRLGVLINLVRALGALLNKEVMSRTIANRAAQHSERHSRSDPRSRKQSAASGGSIVGGVRQSHRSWGGRRRRRRADADALVQVSRRQKRLSSNRCG